jgi:uncharacterized protein YfbU (UPF0304 family)
MTLTTAEKLQILMLCDLSKPAQDRELDFGFIARAVLNGDVWALHWKYPGLGLEVTTPPDVQMVCDVLTMWEHIEESFAKLLPADKARVELESYSGGAPRFLGFDGNNETELMHIARLLVDDLERWSVFKGRGLNSHSRTIETNERLLNAWRPVWDRKVMQMRDYGFSTDELIAVLRERIHPDRRQPAPEGGWTLDATT